jgi:hypothetical protein
VDPRFAAPPGYTTEATLRAKVKSQVSQAANRSSIKGMARSWEDIVERGYVIIGSPDEVAERLREVAVDLNVGHLMLLLQFGNMSRDVATHNTRLFAERVLPQLSGLFDDQWEDRWWPQALPAAERAGPQRPAKGNAPQAPAHSGRARGADPQNASCRSTAGPAACGRRARASRWATWPGWGASRCGRPCWSGWRRAAA